MLLNKHEAHMRNLKLHDHSNKAGLFSIIIILNPQYMCTDGSEKKILFRYRRLSYKEVHYF